MDCSSKAENTVFQKLKSQSYLKVHACNPSPQRLRQENYIFDVSLVSIERPCISKNNAS